MEQVQTQSSAITVLDKRVILHQPINGLKTSVDAVLVAAACPASKAGQRILDMGCGVGTIGICIHARIPGIHLTGIDIQAPHLDIAQKNSVTNNVQNADFIHTDIRRYENAEPFDHVVCNPPYLEAGTYLDSPKDERAKAIGHENSDVSLKDWVECGFRQLKHNGSFTIIHRADQSDKIIQFLGKRFGAIEIIPLWPKQNEDAKRVIIRAIKNRKTPARLSSGLVLHQDNGDYTLEAQKILRDMAAL